MPKIDEWYVTYGTRDNWRRGVDPDLSPKSDRTQHLSGRISQDDRFFDGDRVTTSTIKGKCGGKVLTNSGTLYDLGEPEAAYEKEFPNARERLFNSLPDKTDSKGGQS